MAIIQRSYTSEPGFTADFYKVRDFLIRINKDNLVTPNFTWGRWEWMFSLPYVNNDELHRIGIWEDNGIIVALATYEDDYGEAWFCIDPDYSYLKKDLVIYARDNIAKDGAIRISIDDKDIELQDVAASLNFIATTNKQFTSIIHLDQDLSYSLPTGFKLKSLQDECDIYLLHNVMWKGFGHEEDTPRTPQAMDMRKKSISGSDVRLDLNIFTRDKDMYTSYCGMWLLPNSYYALVEPVATHPNYRKLGLGKAAVLEAVSRCRDAGAKFAIVNTSKQFYYSIGFKPYSCETWWELRK